MVQGPATSGKTVSLQSTALTRRIEEASLNAWPAMQQVLLDGWLLRFSKGFTKRANCIVPLYPGAAPSGQSPAGQADDLASKVRYCENLYAREQLQTIFRLTSLPDTRSPTNTLDALLAARGYASFDSTLVLTKQLAAAGSAPDMRCLNLDDWVAVYGKLTQMPAAARVLHSQILKGIQTPTAFAATASSGGWVACGLAVLEHDLLGLFDIVTQPEARRQGHAQRLVQQLLQWGASQGATRAYLQVVAANQAAANLYAKLGFASQYRYWYRVSS